MKNLSPLHFVLLIFALLISQTAYADEGDLSKDEVINLFSGKTVDAYHVKKDLDIKTYYDPGGTYVQIRDGEKRDGKWYVRDDGYMCMSPSHRDKEFCRIVMKKGDNYRKIKVKGNGKRVYIISYKKFSDGNSI